MSSKTFASALAAAQADMSNPAKNATNPHFRKTYADLASVRGAVLPHFAAHGIAVVQKVDGDGASVTVTTILLWGSECHEFGALTLPLESKGRNAAQAAGVATTYARRYQLMAVAGVAPEDDDGNGMEGNPPRPTRRPPPPPPPPKPKEKKPEKKPEAPDKASGAPTVASLQRELKALWKKRGISGDVARETIARRLDGATLEEIWSNGDALADLLATYDEKE